MEAIKKRVTKFVEDRQWQKFHSAENLSKSIGIEAAELLENFQWGSESFDEKNVKEELADVMIYCLMLAEKLNLDVIEIINEKMDLNEKKYPVDQSKGSSKKYTKL